MKQVVALTDFSNCASNAMEYAVELARILDLELCVIHAISSTEGVDNSIYNAIFIEDYYNNKRQGLAKWVDNFVSDEQHRDVKVKTVCEVGSLSSVITNYVSSNPVEMIVMGTMGSTGISGLFGSNANMVVTKLKIPTLIIPLESKFSADPTITLATDFEANLSGEDVSALKELIAAFRSEKINVLNIVEKAYSGNNEEGENKLKETLSNVELKFNYIQESSTASGIMDFIEISQTDILCVVKHHHNIVYRLFNRSTVNQLMNKSVKAVLVLHE